MSKKLPVRLFQPLFGLFMAFFMSFLMSGAITAILIVAPLARRLALRFVESPFTPAAPVAGTKG